MTDGSNFEHIESRSIKKEDITKAIKLVLTLSEYVVSHHKECNTTYDNKLICNCDTDELAIRITDLYVSITGDSSRYKVCDRCNRKGGI